MTASLLGFVLIQIMLKRVTAELDVNEEQSANTMTFEEREAKCNSGKRYESEVRREAGPEYASAVMWCLESFVNIDSLDDEKFCQKFCQKFCDNVISKLQEALDKSK